MINSEITYTITATSIEIIVAIRPFSTCESSKWVKNAAAEQIVAPISGLTVVPIKSGLTPENLISNAIPITQISE